MDQRNSPCLHLELCVGSSASAVEIPKKQETPVILDSGRPLVPSAEFASFPAPISHLVEEYLPINERFNVETAFAGVQPITLCLSQDVGSKLASCWSIGFLPPNRQWEASDVKIDKEYQIQDYEGCLELLRRKNSRYCQMAIEVLVVKLSNSSRDSLMALNDLRKTIEELIDHLSSVKHVVFSTEGDASCCFTLNDATGKGEEMSQSVYNSKAIFEIIDDLYNCLSVYNTLAIHYLIGIYYGSSTTPASEKYLAKFVIPLNTDYNRQLYHDDAPAMLSTKIMWVCYVNTIDDFLYICENPPRLCHVLNLCLSGKEDDAMEQLRDLGRDAFFFQDNPFIERIVINSGIFGRTLRLPRPSEPLTDNMPRSALVELTLKNDKNAFLNLTHLNNDYFPHLTHLTVIDGGFTGRLDSQRVPRLKTLILESGNRLEESRSMINPLIHEHTQSLIRAGRPWQLVATKFSYGGWSLASYDEHSTNPQDDGKEDAAQSPPFIRELMLVMENQKHVINWLFRLYGEHPLEEDGEDQNVPLLVWTPKRVEKITAICNSMNDVRLHFEATIPEKTPILNSLACHNMHVVVDGAALPNLRSLVLNLTKAELSGKFPQLRTLSFKEGWLQSPWEVDAPMLESLSTQGLYDGKNFTLRPELLPHLSYLRIAPWSNAFREGPTILYQDIQGLSRVHHVVLGEGMTASPSFNQCRIFHVSHLELKVCATQLPKCWEDTEWLCETLTLSIYKFISKFARPLELYVAKVPRLLPRLKKLTITEKDCYVLLDSGMPELTELTVESPKSLGKNLKCPKLTRICFTAKLSNVEKDLCLNPTTYKAIGAPLKWVYFGDSGEANRMSWDVAPSEIGVSAFAGRLEDGGSSCVLRD